MNERKKLHRASPQQREEAPAVALSQISDLEVSVVLFEALLEKSAMENKLQEIRRRKQWGAEAGAVTCCNVLEISS